MKQVSKSRLLSSYFNNINFTLVPHFHRGFLLWLIKKFDLLILWLDLVDDVNILSPFGLFIVTSKKLNIDTLCF